MGNSEYYLPSPVNHSSERLRLKTNHKTVYSESCALALDCEIGELVGFIHARDERAQSATLGLRIAWLSCHDENCVLELCEAVSQICRCANERKQLLAYLRWTLDDGVVGCW